MTGLSSFLHGLRHLGAAALVVLAMLVAGPALAQTGKTNISAQLVAEGPAPAGGTAMLAIHMRPDPGWHGYWLNPGDAGLGMRLDWTLPAGFAAGEPQYPVPQTLIVSGLMNHVYKGDYALLVPITVPANARNGDSLAIRLAAQWLACTDEVCVPESGQMQTRLRIGPPGSGDPRFEAWRAALPAPLDAPARFALAGASLRLAIPLPAAAPLDAPHLFLASDRIAQYAAPQRFSRVGDTLIVELDRPTNAAAEPESFAGVLRMGESGMGLAFAASPGSVPPAGAPLAMPGAPPGLAALPLLLLGALVGGLLLNIMPCVFPILSLKALSLARAGESAAQARKEGLAYTAGVMIACLALGALLLALRAAGEQVGWAFQLQEPGVVALLLVLAAAITANFLGLFELTLPGLSTGGSQSGAFMTGLLAAFAATPCTGPFMAAAMGAALLLPVIPAMALFAALGLGLALPFLALAFVPALRRRLPRPGPWMNRFRRWMALPMGLTALALLWLASRLGGTGFAAACAALVLIVLALLWLIGRRQRGDQPVAVLGLLGLGLAGLAMTAVLPASVRAPSAAGPGVLPSSDYSEAALAAARASGKPVFVYFTADWCLTCKVNERVAIEREDVRDAFSRAGVTVLVGDWTRRDPAITRYLTANGAAGVPFYQWFPAGGGAAEQLPQVLTPATLIERAQAPKG
jgi:thiol:disulfide interchange protein/DsbC/DsbD-like thiol-disulfide interchange protein